MIHSKLRSASSSNHHQQPQSSYQIVHVLKRTRALPGAERLLQALRLHQYYFTLGGLATWTARLSVIGLGSLRQLAFHCHIPGIVDTGLHPSIHEDVLSTINWQQSLRSFKRPKSTLRVKERGCKLLSAHGFKRRRCWTTAPDPAG